MAVINRFDSRLCQQESSAGSGGLSPDRYRRPGKTGTDGPKDARHRRGRYEVCVRYACPTR